MVRELSQKLSGKTIVYFGNEWFAENRTSSHHVARRLSRFADVLYVDTPGMRAPSTSTRDLRRILAKLGQMIRRPVEVAPNLWHITMLQLPFRRFRVVNFINDKAGRWAIRRALKYLGARNTISWFVVPHPGFLAGSIGEELVVYYCIDDYAAHPGVDVGTIATMDEALTRRADVVFVAPPALLEAKRAQNAATHFSPHGVDWESFARASRPDTAMPAYAEDLSRPVIGFFGSIADWIDVALLRYLGEQRPDWTFLMIGFVSTDVDELRALRNFHFVGPQPYETLPGWAKSFDVALMPYKRNRQVENANPLKLREYLATGKPIVSVSTPEVDRFSDYIEIANTPGEYLKAIERALSSDTPERAAARSDSVRMSSWDARVAETARVVSEALQTKEI